MKSCRKKKGRKSVECNFAKRKRNYHQRKVTIFIVLHFTLFKHLYISFPQRWSQRAASVVNGAKPQQKCIMLMLFRKIYPEVTFVVWKGEVKKVTNVSCVAINVVFIVCVILLFFTILCGVVTQPLKNCPCSHYPSGDDGDRFWTILLGVFIHSDPKEMLGTAKASWHDRRVWGQPHWQLQSASVLLLLAARQG